MALIVTHVLFLKRNLSLPTLQSVLILSFFISFHGSIIYSGTIDIFFSRRSNNEHLSSNCGTVSSIMHRKLWIVPQSERQSMCVSPLRSHRYHSHHHNTRAIPPAKCAILICCCSDVLSAFMHHARSFIGCLVV